MATTIKAGGQALPTAAKAAAPKREGANWKAEAAQRAKALKAQAIAEVGSVVCPACYGSGVAIWKRNANGECGRKVGETFIFPICDVCYGDREIPNYGIEDLATALLDMLGEAYRPLLPDGETVRFGTIHYEPQAVKRTPAKRTSLPK